MSDVPCNTRLSFSGLPYVRTPEQVHTLAAAYYLAVISALCSVRRAHNRDASGVSLLFPYGDK